MDKPSTKLSARMGRGESQMFTVNQILHNSGAKGAEFVDITDKYEIPMFASREALAEHIDELAGYFGMVTDNGDHFVIEDGMSTFKLIVKHTANSADALASKLDVNGDIDEWCRENRLELVSGSHGPELWLKNKRVDTYDAALIAKIRPFLGERYRLLIEASEYQLDNPDLLSGWEIYLSLIAWDEYRTSLTTQADWIQVQQGAALERLGYRVATGNRRVIGTAETSELPEHDYVYMDWAHAGYRAMSECDRKVGIYRIES